MRLESLPKTKEMKSKKIVGRGPGSGMGKTSTHGEKGQKARSGLSDLDKYFNDGDEVTPEVLKSRGIIKKQLDGVKVLANGELKKKLTVKAHRFSSVAVTKIEAAGGKTEVI